MASSCHSLLVCGIRLSLFLLPFVGIMALVCPIRLGHILNVPVGSMRPCGLFVKVQGCLPKRLFMPLTPIPDCLPAICPHSCHFRNHNHRPCRWFAQAPLGHVPGRAYRLVERSANRADFPGMPLKGPIYLPSFTGLPVNGSIYSDILI